MLLCINQAFSSSATACDHEKPVGRLVFDARTCFGWSRNLAPGSFCRLAGYQQARALFASLFLGWRHRLPVLLSHRESKWLLLLSLPSDGAAGSRQRGRLDLDAWHGHAAASKMDDDHDRHGHTTITTLISRTTTTPTVITTPLTATTAIVATLGRPSRSNMTTKHNASAVGTKPPGCPREQVRLCCRH